MLDFCIAISRHLWFILQNTHSPADWLASSWDRKNMTKHDNHTIHECQKVLICLLQLFLFIWVTGYNLSHLYLPVLPPQSLFGLCGIGRRLAFTYHDYINRIIEIYNLEKQYEVVISLIFSYQRSNVSVSICDNFSVNKVSNQMNHTWSSLFGRAAFSRESATWEGSICCPWNQVLSPLLR